MLGQASFGVKLFDFDVPHARQPVRANPIAAAGDCVGWQGAEHRGKRRDSDAPIQIRSRRIDLV
jgi:hypothetical protein